MAYLKEEFSLYLQSNHFSNPEGYIYALNRIEDDFNIDIDAEFESDECAALCEMVLQKCMELEKEKENSATYKAYLTRLRKYISFKKEGETHTEIYDSVESAISAYVEKFYERWDYSKSKWEAVKTFGENWNIDSNDFSKMFNSSTKTSSFISLSCGVPKRTIMYFAQQNDNVVRTIFRELYNENVSLESRSDKFYEELEKLAIEYDKPFNGRNALVYLFLRFPEKYYVYRSNDMLALKRLITGNERIRQSGTTTQKMIESYNLLDEVKTKVLEYREFCEDYKDFIDEKGYKDDNFCILLSDFCEFITENISSANCKAEGNMINVERFNEIFSEFKENFTNEHWEDEKFKWEAVKRFQDVWDINAPDFLDMFMRATDKTYNLLASMSNFPRGMIKEFATVDSEFVRAMFINLFDESKDLEYRFEKFVSDAEEIRIKYDPGTWKSHYQNANAISTYLWLRYPDKYYIYKYSECRAVARELSNDFVPRKGKTSDNVIGGKKLYDEVCKLLIQDDEMKDIMKDCITDSCYPDSQMRTLAIDFGFYINRYMGNATINIDGWWPSLKEYNPKLTKDDWKKYITEVELPNHPSPMKMLKGMIELGGEASCKKLSSVYGGSPNFYVGCTMNLGRRVKKYFNLPPCMDDSQERYFAFTFLGKGVDDIEGHQYIYKIRPELLEALNEIDLSSISPYYEEGEKMNSTKIAKNTILYGPPGTGKTYNSACYAVAIIENKDIAEILDEASDNYADIFKRYNEYKKDGLVEFITFHQSYGYEEFIEGIKPVIESENIEDKADIHYSVESGLFKKFCEKASRQVLKKQNQDIGLNKTPTIWKVSLEGTGDNMTRSECMQNGHIRIGYDSYGPDITDDTNFNEGGKNVVNALIYKMKKGDIIFSCYSASTIDAIGVITGDYEWHDEYPHYKRLRKVNWIVKGIREDIVDINNGTQMTLSSVYKLNVSLDDAMTLIQKYAATTVEEKKNHVFIIDEINRGNISKIFGELITLIEDTKRVGAEEELKVVLPYSQKTFGVPENVYILGTMNTADRSIAALDTALRRRFSFVEMMPSSNVLGDIKVNEIDITKMLEKINERIEVLFDREHTIGHAYFIKLKNSPTIEILSDIFNNKIIPLLQEYFYEDYEKIRLVLGDNQVTEDNKQFILKKEIDVASLFGYSVIDIIDDSVCYSINNDALKNSEAYIKIYK